ncbi:FG-GAP repeat domain-containing protein [Aquisphaera insulae]|uniref:FG-GAP repeat domain-containing protein n=1 Tax=Aquisphaera insulae TaxID=2712864 RepID=UPI0013EC453C|nr:VCBS repeat-containing protein [Aquisphaera insulae]
MSFVGPRTAQSRRARRERVVLLAGRRRRRTPLRLEWLEDRIALSTFAVTSADDAGPGTLRQAIIEANARPGEENTIRFEIGTGGPITIRAAAPLPVLAGRVILDGTTQPGYESTPLVTIQDATPDGPGTLVVGSELTVRGVAIEGYGVPADSAGAVLSLQADSGQPSPAVATYRIHVPGGRNLATAMEGTGGAASLSLLGADGSVLMTSSGALGTGSTASLTTYVEPGTYLLRASWAAGAQDVTVRATLTASQPPNQTVSVGSAPGQILSADFNGDGRPDLATANGDATVSILIGNGDGTFQPARDVAVPASATGIAAGDFDGDGTIDLAVTYSAWLFSGVEILLNRGDTTFQVEDIREYPFDPKAIVAADLNGDGVLDLATISGWFLQVRFGRGDGTFADPLILPVSGSRLAVSDMNEDGMTDLVADSNNTITVLINRGDGAFSPPWTVPGPIDVSSFVVGDFNADGHQDVGIAGRAGYVQLILRAGDGTFRAPVVVRTESLVNPEDPIGMTAGDFDGDGLLDLACALTDSSSVVVFPGRGDGTFRDAVSTAAGTGRSLVAEDFNGDGRLDLSVANSDSNDVSVLLGNGDDGFQGPMTSSAEATAMTSGDFTGDGRLDLAVISGSRARISILVGRGDGTFREGASMPAGQSPHALVARDFNNDGRLDLAVMSDSLVIFLGNGDGTFREAGTYPVGSFSELTAADFNGDGVPDVAVATFLSGVTILLGKGDGTFRMDRAYSSMMSGGWVTTGDFNGDGITDLVTVHGDKNVLDGVNPAPYFALVLLGQGDGTFRLATILSRLDPGPIASGDLNGDGRSDLLISDSKSGETAVWLSDGDGTFHLGGRLPGIQIQGGENVRDLDGDGRLDVIGLSSSGDRLSVLKGKGDGTFLVAAETAVQDAAEIAMGDFDGDGRLDIAVGADLVRPVTVLLGEDAGIASRPSRDVDPPAASPLQVDVDGDGSMDLLVVDGAGEIILRRGIPGQPGGFQSPVLANAGYPARDLAWIPRTNQGPIVAAADLQDDAISLYVWRDGSLARVASLPSGRGPMQVLAADLGGRGLEDLVVRNAAGGTILVYQNMAALVGPGLSPFLLVASLNSGAGASDVRAADLDGDGRLDLVVTNGSSGLVVYRNLGEGRFEAPRPYRAGNGLSVVDASAAVGVTGADATAGLATIRLAPGGPAGLVTVNPGTNTLGVLASLGDGRLANPFVIQTDSPALVVRAGDFNADGVSDLAVLSDLGVSLYLGDGRGGFLAPVAYDAGPSADGLTLADATGDGVTDLLIGNAYGDVLILEGQASGAFRPYRKADQAVALAAADLDGDGKPDFVYADQELDRVSIQYSDSTVSILGDRSAGLLAPGAVKLADVTGDRISDLIVANSGSNNILVYPGLGGGQFGQALNGGHGFFAGTNPSALEVKDINGDAVKDLVVANAGSNDVSILLGSGTGSSWTLTAGPRIKTDAGPAAVAVGDLNGDGVADLAVANRQANNVQVFPGVGNGYFNDQSSAVKTYAVGQAPGGLFLGNFDGAGTGLATLDTGSNTITLIDASGSTRTVGTGGLGPAIGFAGDFLGNGFTGLVVANRVDGRMALLLGGVGGLSLSQTLTSAFAPSPTGLSFGGVSGGVLSFYASSAGRESATQLAFQVRAVGGNASDLDGPDGGSDTNTRVVLESATTGIFQQVSELLGVNGSTSSLVASLLTVTALPGEFSARETSRGVSLLASIGPASGPGYPGQGTPDGEAPLTAEGDGDVRPPEEGGTSQADSQVVHLWQRLVAGLDRAWARTRADLLSREGLSEEELTIATDGVMDDEMPSFEALSPLPGSGQVLTAAEEYPIVAVSTEARQTATDAAIEALFVPVPSEASMEPPGAIGIGTRIEAMAAGGPRLASPIATAVLLGAVVEAGRRGFGRRRSPTFGGRTRPGIRALFGTSIHGFHESIARDRVDASAGPARVRAGGGQALCRSRTDDGGRLSRPGG